MSSAMANLFETGGAVVSPNGRYRYRLTRRWRAVGPHDTCLWVMLNPSTADAERDDPTIRRCVGFARRWGYGAIEVVNLFAVRATDPSELPAWRDPIGPDNDVYIAAAAERAARIVAAWGAHEYDGMVSARAVAVTRLLRRHCAPVVRIVALGLAASGAPRHPLRVSYNVQAASYCGDPGA